MFKLDPKDFIEPRVSEVVENDVQMPSGKVTFYFSPLSANDLATMRMMMLSNDPDKVSNTIAWEINRSVVFSDGSRLSPQGEEALPIESIKKLKEESLFAILNAIRQVNNPDPKN